MIKLNTFWDMDNTITRFNEKLDELYPKVYGTPRPDDPTVYKVCDNSRSIFKTEGFFESLIPFYNALAIMEYLHDTGHVVHIITSPMGMGSVAKEKYDWLSRYLPWLDRDNIFMTGRKDLVGDTNSILIDDAPKFLSTWKGITIGIDAPYNQDTVTDYRIYDNNYNFLYGIFQSLAYGDLTSVK